MGNPFLNITLVAAMLFSIAAAAQISDSLFKALPDSLRPKKKSTLTQEEKIKILHNAEATVVSYNYAELNAIATAMEKEMETSANQRTRVLYSLSLASFYSNAGDYDRAFTYYQKTVLYVKANPAYKHQEAEACVYLGGLYGLQFKHDSAVYFLHKGLDVAEGQLDYSILSEAYESYYSVYLNLHLYAEAISYANKGLEIIPKKDKWGHDYTVLVIEKAYLFSILFKEDRQKKYQDSTTSLAYKTMAAKKREAGLWYASCYYCLGSVLFSDNRYKEAIAYYDSSLLPQYITHNVFTGLFTQSKLNKAICLAKLGDAEGLHVLDTLKLPEKSFLDRQLQNQALYEYARSHGKWQDALKYHEKYTQYTDSLAVISQRGQVFEAEQKYSVKEKEADIAVLENKNLQGIARRNKLVAAGAVIVLFFTILVLVLYMRYKRLQVQRRNERQKLADELLAIEHEAQLRSIKLQAEFEAAIDNQRKTISRNIHDEVGSRVALLPMLIADARNNAQEPAVKRILSDIEVEAKSVYTEVREFMHSLNISQAGQNYNVVELLDNLDVRFGIGRGLEVNYEADTEQVEALFTKQQHAEVYRIIKEAVTNTLKHSDAQKMHISIHLKDGFFHLDIRDFGRGLQQSTANGTGMGLAGMQQRMQLLKGSLTAFTGPDGFTISGRFPVAN